MTKIEKVTEVWNMTSEGARYRWIEEVGSLEPNQKAALSRAEFKRLPYVLQYRLVNSSNLTSDQYPTGKDLIAGLIRVGLLSDSNSLADEA